MQDRTKMDYSKLFGFNMVADAVADGVDFQDSTIGARLGAKVGKTDVPLGMTSAALTEDTTRPGEPVMQGLGGRTVTSS